MKACGLIVEYNPFHNGHQYHINEAKKLSQADCMIAVMSGSFLQRGEPAIIDKFHRTKAALASGVDLVIELPYAFAVQSSHYFARGALLSLHALHTDMICFGSEAGEIELFYKSIEQLETHQTLFDTTVNQLVQEGMAFPKASQLAFEKIKIDGLDLFQPNNILGFSYVKTILDEELPIEAKTIKRITNHYHDEEIEDVIASATSIRKELEKHDLSEKVQQTLPTASFAQVKQYKKAASIWHDWEAYFPYLTYRLLSMTKEDLAQIHGVDEGIEGRILQAIHQADSFEDLIQRVKTKRYTRTRIQRMFTHILTNTTKEEIRSFHRLSSLPYVRLLGMTERGRDYLNWTKKERHTPVIANLSKDQAFLYLDERAQDIYYSILPANRRQALRRQEFQLPIRWSSQQN